MSQSTKFFIVIGFLWIIYTTIKGHLANYLQLLFAECNGSGSNTVTGSTTSNDTTSLESFANTFDPVALGQQSGQATASALFSTAQNFLSSGAGLNLQGLQ